MKRSHLLVVSLLTTFMVGVSVGISQIQKKPIFNVSNADNSYTLTLTNGNEIINGSNTSLGNNLSFISSGVSGNNNISIEKDGYLYNSTPITGINKIQVNKNSGDIQIWYGQYVNNEYTWISYVTDTTYDVSGINPNYFKIVASNNAVLSQIKITYSCSDSYVPLDTNVDYSIYINDEEMEGLIDVSSLKEEGETWTKQFKLITDVYPGDVITFKKNDDYINVDASGDGNNLSINSNGFRIVNSYCEDASLYFKVFNSSYDVWLTGNGNDEGFNDLQDAPILQAWNWSINNIQSNLDNIVNAGYKAVQISPLQVQKSYYNGGDWGNEWWKLYQPQSLSIATGSGNSKNVIGTKAELISLCSKAEEKGLSIIVDVVINHLGGSSYNSFDSLVNEFENEIYTNKLYHTYGKGADDSSIEKNVRYSLGDYPDLQTENNYVQSRALSLLKEYLDCGIKGFRFDAAKHIETPYDSSCASDFWPTVINGAKRYAKQKGYDIPYCYGENLGLNTDQRSYNYYTPFMSLTENSQSYDVRDAVANGNTSKISNNYYYGIDASKALIWAESHDLYKEGKTSGLSETQINQIYAIQASRSGSSVMYMARPYDSSTQMKEIGTNYYKDVAVSAANEFKNRYRGYSEYVGTNNGCFYNRRGSGINAGALIVKLTGNNTLNVNVGLNNGTYLDLVSGNYVTVNNNNASITFTDCVAVLVPKNAPTCYVVGNTNFTGSDESWTISSGISMTLTNDNIGEVSDVMVAEGSVIKIYDSTNDEWYGYYQLGSSYSFATLSGDDNIALEAGTYNFYLNNEGNIYLVKQSNGEETYTINWTVDWVYNDNAVILAWVFGGDYGDGEWVETTKISNTSLNLDIDDNKSPTGMAFARFPQGTTTSTANWDNKYNQTGDVNFISGTTSYSVTWQ